MDLMLIRVFQRQIYLQCRFLMTSALELNSGLRVRNTEYVFYNIQNILNAGANISKAMWGQRGRKLEERRPLRESIGVGDDSPLRQVAMRNNFEHLDERLDRWWAESVHHNHADMNIGPKDRSIVGLDRIDMFRLFDPQTTDLTFWGEEFNIQEIVNEVSRILPVLEVEASKPHWQR